MSQFCLKSNVVRGVVRMMSAEIVKAWECAPKKFTTTGVHDQSVRKFVGEAKIPQKFLATAGGYNPDATLFEIIVALSGGDSRLCHVRGKQDAEYRTVKNPQTGKEESVLVKPAHDDIGGEIVAALQDAMPASFPVSTQVSAPRVSSRLGGSSIAVTVDIDALFA